MLLDTDVLIAFLHSNSRNDKRAAVWLKTLPKPPQLTGIAVLETVFGARDQTDLRQIEKALLSFSVAWPIDADFQTAQTLAGLKLSHGVGLLDCVTAALCLRIGAPLATFNVKHFGVVPGLQTVQPFVP